MKSHILWGGKIVVSYQCSGLFVVKETAYLTCAVNIPGARANSEVVALYSVGWHNQERLSSPSAVSHPKISKARMSQVTESVGVESCSLYRILGVLRRSRASFLQRERGGSRQPRHDGKSAESVGGDGSYRWDCVRVGFNLFERERKRCSIPTTCFKCAESDAPTQLRPQ